MQCWYNIQCGSCGKWSQLSTSSQLCKFNDVTMRTLFCAHCSSNFKYMYQWCSSDCSLSLSLSLLPPPPSMQDEGTSVDPERPKYYYIAYEILTSERT